MLLKLLCLKHKTLGTQVLCNKLIHSYQIKIKQYNIFILNSLSYIFGIYGDDTPFKNVIFFSYSFLEMVNYEMCSVNLII